MSIRLARLAGAFAVAAMAGVPAYSQGTAPVTVTVRGVVYDSVGKSPLGGAAVQLVATSGDATGRTFATRSDSLGAFSTSVPPGRYMAGFFHPALDSLGIEIAAVPFEAVAGEHRLNLAIPSPRTLVKSICPADEITDSTAMVIGHVRDTRTQEPIVGATVTLEWSETVIDARGVRNRDRIGRAETQGPGWFAICDVATDIPLLMHAGRGADSSGYVQVEVPDRGVRHVTFLLGEASLVPSPGVDTAEAIRQHIAFPRIWTGNIRLAGMVHDSHGRRVSNAHVLVWDAGPETVTNDLGAFFFDHLPGGTHTVEVRAIGYLPVESIVQLAEERSADARIDLGENAQILPTVTVHSTILYSRKLMEFERHRTHSFGGYFMRPDELQMRPSTQPSSLLEGYPGVFVHHDRGVTTVTMKSFAATADRSGQTAFAGCTPSLYMDGFKSLLDFDALNGFYRSNDFLAIEVYTRELERPHEYQDAMVNCGAIVFWTRPAPLDPRKIKAQKAPPPTW